MKTFCEKVKSQIFNSFFFSFDNAAHEEHSINTQKIKELDEAVQSFTCTALGQLYFSQ